MKNQDLDVPMYIFDVEPLEGGEFELDGESVGIIVFEAVEEGEIIKICTENHDLGITAEYAWINYKYPGYERTKQSLNIMKLNGQEVECDILTIENEHDKKYIFFDISDFFSNPVNTYPEIYKNDIKISENDEPSFEIILHKKIIDNKILLGIHKITGESLNILKSNIENGKPIFVLRREHYEQMDKDSIQNRLKKYLKENKIAYQKIEKR